MDIMKVIPEGRENAISAQALVGLTGCGTARRLRLIVHKAREEGNVICSCQSGYYRPTTEAEIRSFINYLTRHSASTFVALQSAQKALEQLPGQETMEDL